MYIYTYMEKRDARKQKPSQAPPAPPARAARPRQAGGEAAVAGQAQELPDVWSRAALTSRRGQQDRSGRGGIGQGSRVIMKKHF